MSSEKKVEKVCYICGLELREYPYDLESLTANIDVICPCCGTHYGLDDEGGGKVEIPDELVDAYLNYGDDAHKKIINVLRQSWIDGGMKWWFEEDPFDRKPDNWDPKEQLKNIPEDFR